jgi:Kef-type K+ transport system membrane component KefB/Trk K+ transport system NAD-binding subunit
MHNQDLLTAISVSIIAAAVLALLARSVKQPLILGYILAGALLGPNVGLGVVTDEASIELISEIGLILLLFIIGLELSIPRLLQTGRTIIGTGLLQFPLCAALFWFLAAPIAAGTGGPFDRLYLGVALGLSSTLIVVKLLSDKFEMGTLGGRITLGVLIFQDIWAIAFLALQPNLGALRAGPLIGSLAAGAGLVLAAAALSRWVLPRLYRAIAKSPEMVLVTSMAWCFLVAGTAGALGLSKEMGALIAGMTIASFPYGTEVIGRLSGVRDFFVTLFFVALGLKVPAPSTHVLALACLVAGLVVLSRFVSIYGIFAALRLDARTAGVVAINLSQISEFSLVIVSLGAGLGHVSDDLESLVLYAMLLMSVTSTYTTLFNHQIATAIARALEKMGLHRWFSRRRDEEGDRTASGEGHHDLFLLGVSREGLAFLEHLERARPLMKTRIVAVDFNPETLERLRSAGVKAHYGDIANPETLQHAGIAGASVVVSSISDWFLKGIDNRRLLQHARNLAPRAQVIVTADTLAGAEALYREGADYVLLPSALSAEHLYGLLSAETADPLAEARERQGRELFRKEASGAPVQ